MEPKPHERLSLSTVVREHTSINHLNGKPPNGQYRYRKLHILCHTVGVKYSAPQNGVHICIESFP